VSGREHPFRGWCVGDNSTLPLISSLFSKCFSNAAQSVSLGFWASYFCALVEVALPVGIEIGNDLSYTHWTRERQGVVCWL